MGDLGGSGSTYPTGLSSNNSPEENDPNPNATTILAEHINNLRQAVILIETELGLLPKGSYADVLARLNAVDVESVKHNTEMDEWRNAVRTPEIARHGGVLTQVYAHNLVHTLMMLLGTGRASQVLTAGVDDRYNGAFGFKWADAVAATPKTQMKLVTTTYDLSTATGTQAITGAGFQPDFVEIMTALSSGNVLMSSGWHDGTDDFCINMNSSTVHVSNTSKLIVAETGAGAFQEADAQSLDADGMTLSWTKTGSPTGTLTLLLKFIKY